MDDCKLLWRCLACRRAWGTLETWKAPILMPLSIMYTFYISTTLGYLLQQFARSPPSPAKMTASDCAGKSHIEFIISKGWSYGPTSNKMALNFKRTLNPMWVLNIIWIYFRGSAYFLAEQCFRNSLGKGGKWGWVGGQKVMEAGGDSDLSLFTNRVPAKNLPRILVPQKGKWSSSQAGHVVDNGWGGAMSQSCGLFLHQWVRHRILLRGEPGASLSSREVTFVRGKRATLGESLPGL